MIYEYRCAKCARNHDVFKGEPIGCPYCGQEMKRTWTSVAFHSLQDQFLDEGVQADLMANRKDIEKQMRLGTVGSIKEKGPLQFRPKYEVKWK